MPILKGEQPAYVSLSGIPVILGPFFHCMCCIVMVMKKMIMMIASISFRDLRF